jgi:hypothetical protein
MNKLEFESDRDRIRKAFGRPAIDPPPRVIEVHANPAPIWGEPRVAVNRPPRSWRGVGPVVLCAAALVLLVGLRDKVPALPFNATAPAAETWTDTPVADDATTTTMPDHVTGAALDARCEALWAVLNEQDDIRVREGAKPGFTAAYKSASHLEYATALQIRAQGCPIKDPATFDNEMRTIQALDAMVDQQ